MGVILVYPIFLGIAAWCIWGGFSAAKRAFVSKEVRVVGSVMIRGRWAVAIGVLFAAFGLIFCILALALLLAFFK